jgi:hypothetical protein
MTKFQSIEKHDAGILYLLELARSFSVLLLAFGLIASIANVNKRFCLYRQPYYATHTGVNAMYRAKSGHLAGVVEPIA